MNPLSLPLPGKLAAVATVLGAICVPLTLRVTAHADPGQQWVTKAPVINSNFPDPDIIKVGNVYHAFATNSGGQNVQHAVSHDLIHWTHMPDAAPTLGAWVDDNCTFAPGGIGDHCTWAPTVTAVNGHYVLYYTARDRASHRQCVGASTSDSPDGPFEPVGSQPLLCPVSSGGAIDASTYAENGRLYLLWKADGNCCGLPAVINIQPLSADGLTVTADPTPLIQNDQAWEGAVVEAPTLIKRDGTYYLLYSANNFAGGAYRTGYATATNLAGPYTKHGELMSTDRFRDPIIGPGGETLTTAPDGSTVIAFHGWDPTYTYRAMYVRELDFSADGVPHVQGTATRYEAEAGTIVDARVVDDDAASGGRKVGFIDHPDSSVTVNVHADTTGPATLRIRFDNGSLDPSGYRVQATDAVTVNGKDTGTVTFPHTSWGNWQQVDYPVQLVSGWNSITFTKKTFFTELDAIDLY
jgi:arabinan endo-1,5-alpha-L-arabinosidase